MNGEQFELAEKHGLESPIVHKHVGCNQCRNTGFRGREGIFELLFVNRDVDDTLAADPSLGQLRDAAVKAGMVPMFDHGVQKVAAGITTFEEVFRVCESG